QAKPCWPHLAGIFLLSLLSIPLQLLTPLPLKIAVDSVIGSHAVPRFIQAVLPAPFTKSETAILGLAVGLVVAIAALSRLLGLGSWFLQTYTREKLILDFRSQLFRHVQRLSLSYLDTRGTTDSPYRIQYDAPSIAWVLVEGIPPLLVSGLTLLGMFTVVGRIDWQLAIVALAVSPALFALARALSRRLRSRWNEVKEQDSSAMSVIQEALAAVRVVKAFGQEDREQKRFIGHASRGMWGQVHLALIEGGFHVLVGLTIAAGTAAALFLGVLHVRSGALTLGELLLVMAYLAQLYGPLEIVAKKIADLQSSVASADRAFSTASTCASTGSPTSANSSPSSSRSRCSSRPASRRTSPTRGRPPASARLSRPPRPPTLTSSSSTCPRATRPGSASAGCACPAVSASGSRWPAPSSRTRRSSFSTSPPARSTWAPRAASCRRWRS